MHTQARKKSTLGKLRSPAARDGENPPDPSVPVFELPRASESMNSRPPHETKITFCEGDCPQVCAPEFWHVHLGVSGHHEHNWGVNKLI